MATINNIIEIVSNDGTIVTTPVPVWKLACKIARHDPVTELMIKAKAGGTEIGEEEADAMLVAAREYNEEQDALKALKAREENNPD